MVLKSQRKLDEDGYTIIIKDNVLKVKDVNDETILIGRKLNGFLL